MPNWCQNNLRVTGSPKELNKMMKDVELTDSEATENHSASPFSCHRVIPRPVSQDPNWWDWNIANWGSKWDLDGVGVGGDWEKGALVYWFETAWSPITPVVEALAKKYPKLTFFYSYHEGGSDFWGEHEFENGEQTAEEGGELSSASCEVLNRLMGSDHHYCHSCWDSFECDGEDTVPLCPSCYEEESKGEEQLWEGDEHGKPETEEQSATKEG